MIDLAGISVVPHPDDPNRFMFHLLDSDANITYAAPISRAALTRMFAVIGEALQPGLLASLNIGP